MAQERRNRNNKKVSNGESRFTVRGIRRDPVDISKLSKALIGLAMAEDERAAQAEHASHALEQPQATFEREWRTGGVDDV